MRPLLCTAALLLLAGCGGSAASPPVRQPHLPHALATTWRAQADAVAAALAAGDGCTARARATALQSSVIAAVNEHRVSPRFQETLLSAANDLSARVTCTPPPAPAPAPKPHGHPKKPHPPHGHGHGKKR